MTIYLLTGVGHFCHSNQSGETVCYGGRECQNEAFYRASSIKRSTNEALANAKH